MSREACVVCGVSQADHRPRRMPHDFVELDDQCPITDRRCDRPCGAECIRGMFAATDGAPVTADSGADQPTLRDQLAEVVASGLRTRQPVETIAARLLPVIEADLERAKAEAVQRVLDLADELDYCASKTTGGTAAYGYTEAAERIRAAVTGKST